MVRARREFLHVSAEIVRAGYGAQLLFPLALDPRRLGGVAEKGLLVGGDMIADGSERDAHKENGCDCGGAFHGSPRMRVVFCLKAEKLKIREFRLTITPRLVTFSGEEFGHEDVMAGNLDGHIGSERGGAGFREAKMAIKGRKRRARAEDTKIDGPATRFAKVIFCGIHHFAA